MIKVFYNFDTTYCYDYVKNTQQETITPLAGCVTSLNDNNKKMKEWDALYLEHFLPRIHLI